MLILIWLIYGLLTGLLARAIHPGDDKLGLLPTILLGIIGSYAGGFIQFCLGHGHHPLQSSGILFGVMGGIIVLSIYRWYILKSAGRSFWTGKPR